MDQPIATHAAHPGPRFLRPHELDDYVAHIDSLGGLGTPAANAFVALIGYAPDVAVDTTLDPFSPEYSAQQLALYSEIAGRPLDQLANEDTPFDIERHAAAVNSYDHGIPAVLAEHWLRLAALLRLAAPLRGHWLCDMGCGWGLTSEFMAQSGLNVLAMDVNAKFVELVNRRAARLGLSIAAVQGEFESYGPPHPVDLVLFYECLHHAPRPWFVLARMATALSRHPGAQFLLAGEPIQSHWWPHWGMRLDAGSIYVMRKYGWFESGWSMPFILRCLAAAGVEPRVAQTDGLGEVIAAGHVTGLGLSWLGRLAEFTGLSAKEGSACAISSPARVQFGALPYPGTWRLHTRHEGDGPLGLMVNGETRLVPPGPAEIDIEVNTGVAIDFAHAAPEGALRIEGFQWFSRFA